MITQKVYAPNGLEDGKGTSNRKYPGKHKKHTKSTQI